MNQSLNSQQMRFYAGTAWEELQREADRISHHYAGNKRLSEADRITFIEESSRLCGGIEAVQSIVPRVRLRHREWLEHALANLLSGIQRLEGITTIDMEQRAQIHQEALAIVGLMDAGDEQRAEQSIRELEQRVEQLAVDGLDRDVEQRLANLDKLIEAAA